MQELRDSIKRPNLRIMGTEGEEVSRPNLRIMDTEGERDMYSLNT
jgi:hypothetical protein